MEGPNVFSEPRRPSPIAQFGRHLAHRFALLLWVGAALAYLGERFSPGEGMSLIAAALVAVVLFNGAFSFWQELRVEKAMAAFREMLAPTARVLRHGTETEIDVAGLVVGDVIVLREGDRVPADARLLEAHRLKVDNSPLTGESEPQLRTISTAQGVRLDARNLVFSGTLVTTGTGTAVVYATGNHTELGRIAGITRDTKRVETPIRRELRYFTRVITAVALGLGISFFAAGWAIGNPLWTNLIFAIGIIVANVPEGILPTVTLALAIAGRKMAKRNALVKTLESAATLGSTTVICTDKTGTLTRGQMRVSDLRLGADLRAPEDDPSAATYARLAMALCNNSTLRGSGPELVASGDPTEVALSYYVEELDPCSVEQLRAANHRIHECPFDSATKEMTTVHRTQEGLQAFLKGAPEVVVGQCKRVAQDHDSIPLNPEATARFVQIAEGYARTGKRVLALARKHVDASNEIDDEVAASDYTLIGLVAMQDPPRNEVSPAVAQCLAAGIRVIVVSGDHPLTVEAIARQVGIRGKAESTVHTGAEIEAWDDAGLRNALEDDAALFARTSPQDKLRIVSILQECGHIVAVTGDGVNDAPALKHADLGIAMGKTGTDVAREAADMVLMDDNFATIVAAIEEGRVIYGNIRRFIGYVLTSNVPEILPYVAFVLLGIPLPLPVLLILAVDLGTDMAPAIGLASESAETDVMAEPPRPPDLRLLSPELLLSSYLLWGLIEAAAGFAAYFWELHAGGWKMGEWLPSASPLYGRSIAAFFTAIVICQVANVMIWRTTRQSLFSKGLLGNRSVLAGVAAELLLLLLVVHTEFGHRVFGTESPSLVSWLIPVVIALVMLAVSEVLKAGKRHESPPERKVRDAAYPLPPLAGDSVQGVQGTKECRR